MSRFDNRFDTAIDPLDLDAETIERLVARGRHERSKAIHAMFARLFRSKDRTEQEPMLGGQTAHC
ncbi:MAG: hypothetical protein AAGD23_11945 [Pseudomonadota bacterium]